MASRVGGVFVKILSGVVLSLAGAGFVAVVAAVLVWPLWYLATTNTSVYTALVIAGMVVFSLWRMIVGISERRNSRAFHRAPQTLASKGTEPR